MILIYAVYVNGIAVFSKKQCIGFYQSWAALFADYGQLKDEVSVRVRPSTAVFLPR